MYGNWHKVVWTPERLERLKALVDQRPRLPKDTICARLGCSRSAMTHAMHNYGIGGARIYNQHPSTNYKTRAIPVCKPKGSPIKLDLGRPKSLTARLMGDPLPGRTPWAA